jgi:hypothetical protein
VLFLRHFVRKRNKVEREKRNKVEREKRNKVEREKRAFGV